MIKTKQELLNHFRDINAMYNNPFMYQTLNDMIDELLEQEQKTGHWKTTYLDHVAMGERPSILYCSVCHRCIMCPTNYCPNCGAKMQKEGEQNDDR